LPVTTLPSAERPRIVTIALAVTMALGVFTLAFRPYLSFVVADHDAGGLIVLFAAEAFVLGSLMIVLAVLSLEPRPVAHVLLRIVYVLALLDALVWVLLTPVLGGFIAVLMTSGHGGDSDRANAFATAAAIRWIWVVFKMVLMTGLFTIISRQGRAWLKASSG
jgi:hypothetical protein